MGCEEVGRRGKEVGWRGERRGEGEVTGWGKRRKMSEVVRGEVRR